MSLADLIRGKRKPVEVATATHATVATPEQAEGVTVASVATVTVAKPRVPDASPANEPTAPVTQAPRDSGLWLDARHEAAIRAWLATIGETDPEVIRHVLAQCAEKPGLRDYLFSLTDDGTMPENRRTCRQCANLRGGICAAQANGGKLYRPQVDTLFRCEWYQPSASDDDQRTALDRWPGLSQRARQS